MEEQINLIRKLKGKLDKTSDKLSYYKNKSMRLDDTVVINDMKIKKQERQTIDYEQQVRDIQEKFDRLAEKYRSKRKDYNDMKDKIIQGSKTVNPNFLALVLCSLLFGVMFKQVNF